MLLSSNEYDIILKSEDRNSTVQFKVLEVELARNPSISFRVQVKEPSFSGEIITWIDNRMLINFLSELKELNTKKRRTVLLESMSPEELIITIESEKIGVFLVSYSVKDIKYSRNKMIETRLMGQFEFDKEYFIELEEDINSIIEFIG
jgi:hypothetical protein